MRSTFPTLIVNKKIANWPELESKDFINEIKKQKFAVTLSEQSQWLTYFVEEQHEIKKTAGIVQNLLSDIDKLVFAIYDISDDEVSLI